MAKRPRKSTPVRREMPAREVRRLLTVVVVVVWLVGPYVLDVPPGAFAIVAVPVGLLVLLLSVVLLPGKPRKVRTKEATDEAEPVTPTLDLAPGERVLHPLRACQVHRDGAVTTVPVVVTDRRLALLGEAPLDLWRRDCAPKGGTVINRCTARRARTPDAYVKLELALGPGRDAVMKLHHVDVEAIAARFST